MNIDYKNRRVSAYITIIAGGALLLAGGLWFVLVGHTPTNTPNDDALVEDSTGAPITESLQADPVVPQIKIGAAYGRFRVRDVNSESGSARTVVQFDGSEEIAGTLLMSSFPALIFTVDEDHAYKLPRICRDTEGRPSVPRTIIINDPSPIQAQDFTFVSEGNSKPKHAIVHITNLRMSCPPVDASGSADVTSVTYTE